MSLHHGLRAAAGAAATLVYVGGYSLGYLGTTSNISVTLTSLTGGVEAAPAENDVVIVYFATGSNASSRDFYIGSNFTRLARLYADDTADTHLEVAYKVMGSSPDTSVSIVGGTGNAADGGAVAVHVWRNADTRLPIEVLSTATGTNSVLCNPPSITPTLNGAVILAGGGGGHTAGGGRTFGAAALSNFVTVGSQNDTYDSTVGVGSFAWTSGAYDPAAFTFSTTDSTNYSWAAVTLALIPRGRYTGAVPTQRSVSAVAGASGTTSLTVNKPSGVVSGDFLFAIMAAEDGAGVTWTGDTGWTEIADQGVPASLRIAYKVAGGSEPSTYTFTTSAITTVIGTIVAFTSSAYDSVGGFSTDSGSSNVTGPDAGASFSLMLCCAATITGIGSITQFQYPGTVEIISSAGSVVNITLWKQLVPKGPTGVRLFLSNVSNSTVVATLSPA